MNIVDQFEDLEIYGFGAGCSLIQWPEGKESSKLSVKKSKKKKKTDVMMNGSGG